MPDTNDIDALLRLLEGGGWVPARPRVHAALTALVAERNKAQSDFSEAWRERSEFAKRIDEADAEILALRKRVAELEANPPADRDSGLRERLVCAALTGIMADSSNQRYRGHWAVIAVQQADLAIAAMRLGER